MILNQLFFCKAQRPQVTVNLGCYFRFSFSLKMNANCGQKYLRDISDMVLLMK